MTAMIPTDIGLQEGGFCTGSRDVLVSRRCVN